MRNDWWVEPLIPDLTKRDLYRFRVTSAIFQGVERAGGKIEQSPMTGKVTFLVRGRKVDCSIVEKLVRSFSAREEARRIMAIDDKRWERLRQCAAGWEERDKLLAFLAEVEKRAADEPPTTIADSSLDDWIVWARERVNALDPLRGGAAGMFKGILKVSWWG